MYLLSVLYESLARATISSKTINTDNHRGGEDGIIANNLAADEDGAESLSQCFTEDAVVKDEGEAYNGRAAIKEWKARASEKYQYTSMQGGITRPASQVVAADALHCTYGGIKSGYD